MQTQEGASGAFFKGVFATVLATPCSGPLLGSIFGYLLTQPPVVVYCVFAAMGLGMASPYLLIGVFPTASAFCPSRAHGWKPSRRSWASCSLGTVVYLFTTLTAAYFIPTLTLLVGIWFGGWLIGRTPLTVGPRRRAVWPGRRPLLAALVGTLAFTLLLVEPKIAWQTVLAGGRRQGPPAKARR